MTDPNEFINRATADVIKGFISREDTTKAAVAKGAGFSVATMTRLVSGNAEIPISRLYDIARALGISAQEILDAADKRAAKLSEVAGQNVTTLHPKRVEDMTVDEIEKLPHAATTDPEMDTDEQFD
ncbi:helix-turn-helix transcriptional regulator [Curtobacterium sp. P97]|uniref:helix-turn-helix domain-containing protein n=1 Tax=Curtobacterium sp. P97 TaxID=2939562 RepID=UPI00203D09B8|nr:helix-turn-helix transcriptional regulator [Curtobacterium sp. P97]MCM3521736.1 helix-turn-helix transcriptional regulator [Curtobacterium sp. P97]